MKRSLVFVALSAFVSNESDPWSVGDPQDMRAMQQASLAFEAWEHSVGGVHPDACVCFFCSNKPSLVEAAADAETRGWEQSSEEEVDGFLDETDVQAIRQA